MKKLKITFGLLLLFCLSVVAAETSFVENFSSSLPTYWQSTAQYTLSVQNGELNIKVAKNAKWSQFQVTLPQTLDLSANPFVSLKARISKSARILIYLVDAANQNYPLHTRILYSENGYSNILFDFTNAASTVDLTQITKLYIGVNGDAIAWDGNLWFKEIRVGAAAVKKATVGAVKNQTYYHGTVANELLLTDINNATNIIVEGAAALIDNVVVSPLSSSVYKLVFNAKANVSGTAEVKVISVPNAGYQADTTTFNITVQQNLPPTAVIPSALEVKTGAPITFSITDITNGNLNAEQKMNFSLTKVSGSSIQIQSAVYDTLAARINVNAQVVSAGQTVYKLVIKDNGGGLDSLVSNITINAYTNFNLAPDCTVPASVDVLLSKGTSEIPILDLTDGNNPVIQDPLTYDVVSTNTSVVNNVSIIYIDGNPMQPAILFTPVKIGKAQLQLTIADSGLGYDNGAKQTVKTIDVNVQPDPLYGYVIDLANFDAEKATKWKIEAEGTGQTVTADNFGGQPCLKIVGTNKGQWNGLWYRNPKLDLTDNPVISYEVYVVDNPIQTHVYFWDNNGLRNAPGAESERKTVPANEWTTLLMDFRGASKMVTNTGVPINAHSIDSLLFNYNPSFPYPFISWTGTMYIRNIRIGNAVTNVPPIVPVVTIDNPGNKSYHKNSGNQKITITGITCGANCSSTPTVSIKSNTNASLLSNVALSSMRSDSIDLNFTVGASTGNTTITLEVTAEGSTAATVVFTIYVVNDVAAYTFSVDTNTKKQTIAGFGGNPKAPFIDQFLSTGATVVRLFPEGDAIEPINDNSSPNTLDRSKFLDSGLQIEYIKTVAAAGVKDFVLTLLSPPSWMKQNLSSSWAQSAAETWANSINKVDPIYYDEYVEFLVACVQLIKERTGVELMGICPQNEPAFSQPYGSAILDPVNYATICGMLGKRLSAMGFKTKVINSEQVFGQGFYPVTDYIAAVRANADANKYTSVIGMHYPTNTASTFQTQYTAASASPYPKEYWGMEMSALGNDWAKVIAEMQTMTTALNNGVGLWLIYGWNGAPLLTNSINAVGSQIAMTYGDFATRHFYAVKNIFNHFKPGSQIVASTVTPSTNQNLGMVANFNPNDSVLSIVWTNSGTTSVVGTLPTGIAFDNAKFVRTSEYEFYQEVNPVMNEKILLPGRSVTTLSVSVAKLPQGPNAVPEVDATKESEFVMYPNPANNQLNLMTKYAGDFSVTIVDLTGRTLLTKTKQSASMSLDISNLKPGIYNVMIKADKVLVKKLVVQ